MLGCGLQVLAQRQHVTAHAAQVGEDVEQFFQGFAETQHEAGLGEHFGSFFLALCKEVERSLVVCIAADAVVQPRHGFGVMVEDIRSRLDDSGNRRAVAEEVGDENFHGRPGSFAGGEDALVEMFGAAIGQVVARHRCDHDMFQAQACGGFGNAFGFVGFNLFGLAFGN